MDTQAPGSFIPKNSMVPGAVGAPKSTGGGSIFTMIGVVLFIASLGAAGAAYGYEKVLDGQVTSKIEEIERNRDAFSIDGLETLTRTDARLSETAKLLRTHVAPSLVFEFLSEQTLQKVQLTSFEYIVGKDGSAGMHLTGIADSLQTVALQSDKLGEAKDLKNILISDLLISDGGKIGFSVKADIAASAILYSKSIGAAVDSAPGASTIPDASFVPPANTPSGSSNSPVQNTTPAESEAGGALEF